MQYRRPRRIERSSHYLNRMPRRGLYCVVAEKHGSDKQVHFPTLWQKYTPLVCHEVFQDALDDDDVPDTQGVTGRGSQRDVVCEGQLIAHTDYAPYKRHDGRKVAVIHSCKNRTKKQDWRGGRWVDVEDTLDSLPALHRDSVVRPALVVTALVGLVAVLRRVGA